MTLRNFIKTFVLLLLLSCNGDAQTYKLHDRHAFKFPTAGLVSYWKLNETSGTRVDSVTASGNDLTDNATVTSNPGKVGTAAQFTAANSEYLSHTDNASLSTGDIDFTFALWVYLDSKTTDRVLISKWDAGTQREYLLRYLQTTDRFQWLVSPDGVANTPVSADNFGIPSTVTWYFVVAYHDSVANTIGISVNNGTFNTAAHTTGVQNGTASFVIGQVNAAFYMDGRIDEVGFWKRKLTAQEITTLWNGGAGITYQ